MSIPLCFPNQEQISSGSTNKLQNVMNKRNRRSRSDRLFKLSTSSSVTWPPNTTFLIPSDGWNQINQTKESLVTSPNYLLARRSNKSCETPIERAPGGAVKRRRRGQGSRESGSRTRWADPRWISGTSSRECSFSADNAPEMWVEWRKWPRARGGLCSGMVGFVGILKWGEESGVQERETWSRD